MCLACVVCGPPSEAKTYSIHGFSPKFRVSRCLPLYGSDLLRRGDARERRLRIPQDDDNVNDLGTGESASKVRLPRFPGEHALQHESQKWVEATERILAEHGLLEAAHRGDSAAVQEIIDYDLSALESSAS